MSMQRYISTSFWDDEWITTLDPSEKLLYLYLMTNPLTNIAGVYKLSIRRICFDTGFNADTVVHIMAKFAKSGKAYQLGEYMALPSWPEHQKWETKQTIRDGIISTLAKLPDNILTSLLEIKYRFDLTLLPGYHTHTIHLPYPQQPPPTPYQPSYSDLNSDLNSDSDRECADALVDKPPLPTSEPDDPDYDSELDPKNWNSAKPEPQIADDSGPAPPKTKRFSKPSVEEIQAYCQERKNNVDAHRFMDFYEAKGWKIGSQPMKDWQAAVRTWESRDDRRPGNARSTGIPTPERIIIPDFGRRPRTSG
jgi:hypothetical protein